MTAHSHALSPGRWLALLRPCLCSGEGAAGEKTDGDVPEAAGTSAAANQVPAAPCASNYGLHASSIISDAIADVVASTSSSGATQGDDTADGMLHAPRAIDDAFISTERYSRCLDAYTAARVGEQPADDAADAAAPSGRSTVSGSGSGRVTVRKPLPEAVVQGAVVVNPSQGRLRTEQQQRQHQQQQQQQHQQQQEEEGQAQLQAVQSELLGEEEEVEEFGGEASDTESEGVDDGEARASCSRCDGHEPFSSRDGTEEQPHSSRKRPQVELSAAQRSLFGTSRSALMDASDQALMDGVEGAAKMTLAQFLSAKAAAAGSWASSFTSPASPFLQHASPAAATATVTPATAVPSRSSSSAPPNPLPASALPPHSAATASAAASLRGHPLSSSRASMCAMGSFQDSPAVTPGGAGGSSKALRAMASGGDALIEYAIQAHEDSLLIRAASEANMEQLRPRYLSRAASQLQEQEGGDEEYVEAADLADETSGKPAAGSGICHGAASPSRLQHETSGTLPQVPAPRRSRLSGSSFVNQSSRGSGIGNLGGLRPQAHQPFGRFSDNGTASAPLVMMRRGSSGGVGPAGPSAGAAKRSQLRHSPRSRLNQVPDQQTPKQAPAASAASPAPASSSAASGSCSDAEALKRYASRSKATWIFDHNLDDMMTTMAEVSRSGLHDELHRHVHARPLGCGTSSGLAGTASGVCPSSSGHGHTLCGSGPLATIISESGMVGAQGGGPSTGGGLHAMPSQSGRTPVFAPGSNGVSAHGGGELSASGLFMASVAGGSVGASRRHATHAAMLSAHLERGISRRLIQARLSCGELTCEDVACSEYACDPAADAFATLFADTAADDAAASAVAADGDLIRLGPADCSPCASRETSFSAAPHATSRPYRAAFGTNSSTASTLLLQAGQASPLSPGLGGGAAGPVRGNAAAANTRGGLFGSVRGANVGGGSGTSGAQVKPQLWSSGHTLFSSFMSSIGPNSVSSGSHCGRPIGSSTTSTLATSGCTTPLRAAASGGLLASGSLSQQPSSMRSSRASSQSFRGGLLNFNDCPSAKQPSLAAGSLPHSQAMHHQHQQQCHPVPRQHAAGGLTGLLGELGGSGANTASAGWEDVFKQLSKEVLVQPAPAEKSQSLTLDNKNSQGTVTARSKGVFFNRDSHH